MLFIFENILFALATYEHALKKRKKAEENLDLITTDDEARVKRRAPGYD